MSDTISKIDKNDDDEQNAASSQKTNNFTTAVVDSNNSAPQLDAQIVTFQDGSTIEFCHTNQIEIKRGEHLLIIDPCHVLSELLDYVNENAALASMHRALLKAIHQRGWHAGLAKLTINGASMSKHSDHSDPIYLYMAVEKCKAIRNTMAEAAEITSDLHHQVARIALSAQPLDAANNVTMAAKYAAEHVANAVETTKQLAVEFAVIQANADAARHESEAKHRLQFLFFTVADHDHECAIRVEAVIPSTMCPMDSDNYVALSETNTFIMVPVGAKDDASCQIARQLVAKTDAAVLFQAVEDSVVLVDKHGRLGGALTSTVVDANCRPRKRHRHE